jgi:hypothetical protein
MRENDAKVADMIGNVAEQVGDSISYAMHPMFDQRLRNKVTSPGTCDARFNSAGPSPLFQTA